MQLDARQPQQSRKKVFGSGPIGLALVTSMALAGCTIAPVQESTASSNASDTGASDLPGQSPTTTASTATARFYGSKSPYHPFQGLSSYSTAPDGYEPVFVEHVARHGSRLLSSKKYDDLSYQLWLQAEADGALTELGKDLGPKILKLTELNEKLGYGNLTELGADEHQGIAQRTYERQKDFFDSSAKDGNPIQIVTSGKDRAVDSGRNFAATLAATSPEMASVLQEPTADEDLLYFHKSDANADYQKYKKNDPRIKRAMGVVENDSTVRAASRHLFEKLYTADFVDRIEAGEFDFVDHGKGETHLDDLPSAADCIFNLYLISPGISAEGDWSFDRFVPAQDAKKLAYLVDSKNFYEKGPGFAGEDITFRMAGPLVDDFFDQIQQKKDGTSDLAADFRFAHAETIMPFVAALELEGSTVQADEDTAYSYENNPWRGEAVSPMAANVQWDAYANDEGSYAVRMLYNEKETHFKTDCKPLSEGSFFYDFDELKKCYANEH